MKTSAAVAAAAATVPALSGVAAAHFPVELDIDVQPGNDDNFVDLNEHEYVSVAVHRSVFLNGDGERETFDPTEREVAYRLGSRTALDDGAGARPTENGEVTETTTGHGEAAETTESLVLSFPVAETGLETGDDTVWLYWERDDSGEHGYAGVDTVSVYGGTPPADELVGLLRRLLRG
ncbi:hypothetical protein AUR64_10280 [Haloprofundus marisrubri]|uniref:Uncharacterized protein n=1 Tax=Haloprofundus marisrubri TaxID=1514971 RepID=A0A0W1RAQ2_9EURY|nr:hypothetical protein AUR64_10280 [Haloprofundus marisrubri]